MLCNFLKITNEKVECCERNNIHHLCYGTYVMFFMFFLCFCSDAINNISCSINLLKY